MNPDNWVKLIADEFHGRQAQGKGSAHSEEQFELVKHISRS